MNVSTAKTVRELALENPAATRIFEKLGIDYCCGGNQSLELACERAHLSVDQVIDSLEMAEESSLATKAVHVWTTEPLSDLASYITNTHHKYTREEIARLRPLLLKVCSVHGKNHSELFSIQTSFEGLAQELTMHMMKEEKVLFPYIVRIEEASIEGSPFVPAPFGTVQNPIAMMVHEHDTAGNALQAMREASKNYQVPPDACISYETLFNALHDFEADLHQHIHLENNILFPRAVAIEERR
jgi:regulator of cell morphogenesis and NO signaling